MGVGVEPIPHASDGMPWYNSGSEYQTNQRDFSCIEYRARTVRKL